MPHRSHLYTEKLSSETLKIIDDLQPWLLEVKYTTYVQGRAESPSQHGIYEGDDRFNKLAPVMKALNLETQVDSNGLRMIRLLRIQEHEILAMNPMGCSYIIPLRIVGSAISTWRQLATMNMVHITEGVILDLEGYFLHVVCGQGA